VCGVAGFVLALNLFVEIIPVAMSAFSEAGDH